jgi:hypothetical protein
MCVAVSPLGASVQVIKSGHSLRQAHSGETHHLDAPVNLIKALTSPETTGSRITCSFASSVSQIYIVRMSTHSPPENNLPESVATEKNLAFETTEKPVDEVQDGLFIEDGLRRGLLGRHITLISLASVIGASCFYGFGYALYLSGPLGALIGFSIVGECSVFFLLKKFLMSI